MSKTEIANALHESGHALALHDEGRQVNSVSLNPPVTKYRSYNVFTWEETVSHLFCVMAGKGAEFKWQNKPLEELSYNGTDSFATGDVLTNWSHRDRKLLVQQAIRKTDNWLSDNYHRVEQLARSLYKHEHLNRNDLEILL